MEPLLLHRLRSLNRSAHIIGAHNQLIAPDDDAGMGPSGTRWFLAENQRVWRAGYVPDEENPQVVIEQSDGSMETTSWRLDAFLLHEILGEAIYGAPVRAATTRAAMNQVGELLREHFTLVFDRSAFAHDNEIGGIWSDGRILVNCTSGYHGNASLRVGARERQHIADSALRTVGGWTWFYN